MIHDLLHVHRDLDLSDSVLHWVVSCEFRRASYDLGGQLVLRWILIRDSVLHWVVSCEFRLSGQPVLHWVVSCEFCSGEQSALRWVVSCEFRELH